MSIRNVILCTCVIIAANTFPAFAHVNFDVDIGVPPPAPVVEMVPEPRPGYFWAPGYWGWEDDQHVWVNGRWREERPGYAWVPQRWEQRGDRWHFNHGYWEGREHGHREHEAHWEHGHGHNRD